jgi:hypothetical protein
MTSPGDETLDALERRLDRRVDGYVQTVRWNDADDALDVEYVTEESDLMAFATEAADVLAELGVAVQEHVREGGETWRWFLDSVIRVYPANHELDGGPADPMVYDITGDELIDQSKLED